MKTIELTDEEVELIDDALTWFWKETMDWVDADAKKYNGYNPAGCKEVIDLVKTAVHHYKIGELMSKFDDYLVEVKGEDELDKIAEQDENNRTD